jgi:hypothetical protein
MEKYKRLAGNEAEADFNCASVLAAVTHISDPRSLR